MLDLKLIRQNPEAVKAALGKRKLEYIKAIDELIIIDEKKRIIQQKADELKSERNNLSKSIKSQDEAINIQAQVKSINAQIQVLDQEQITLNEALEAIILYMPNLPSSDTPDGKDERENQEIHSWGNKPILNSPKPHWEIAEALGILDFENTTRLSGSRFGSFIGQGAKLQRALIQFMLEEAANANYLELSPPAIIQGQILRGTGQLPKFAEDLYHLENTDQYLIPTAEVPLTGFYANGQALKEADLPKKLCAYTPCFRSEAGAAGRDTRGLIRQHQFDKIELVHICKPEDSFSEHEKLVRQAENILEKLELPYRRILLCAGDMGFSASKCYDLEVWFPSQNQYREISSCSNCTDFQARRLNLKFKRDQKNELVHTLNGSGLAVGRTWAAIVENYQLDNKLGFKIPKVLQDYMKISELS
jgi:seryl-tRNA synthetase